MTSAPSPNPTRYMKGTRRLDEIMATARELAYQENYSYTEGWNDNTVAGIVNLGLNQIYDKICQVDNVANIEEYRQTVRAGIQEYDIPQDVNMKIQVMNVRYLYGPQDWQFITLEQGMIQDRFGYPTNIPSTYCIRNGKILLSPTPNITRENALIVNYQKRMRSLDFRRGKVTDVTSPYGTVTSISNANPAVVTTSAPHNLTTGDRVGLIGVFEPLELTDSTFLITVTGANTFTLNGIDTTSMNVFSGTCLWFKTPITIQLNFAISSQKDVNLQANADALLDKVDYCCIIDKDGLSLIDAVAINNYNTSTYVITCEPNFVIPYEYWLAFRSYVDNGFVPYVVSGDYASSHSQLDRKAEDLLIEYVVLRLLRLQSAAEPTRDQLEAEQAVLERIAIAYRRYRPSVNPIIWQKRYRTNTWFMGGRGFY